MRHLEWWRFTAPFLADRFRLAAIDLSGNGNSGWRERYTGKGFADEVWAVRNAAHWAASDVVGHSFRRLCGAGNRSPLRRESGGILFMDFTVAPPRNPRNGACVSNVKGSSRVELRIR